MLTSPPMSIVPWTLDPLADEFEVDFVSEHDEEYDDYDHPDTPVRKINIEGLENVKRNN